MATDESLALHDRSHATEELALYHAAQAADASGLAPRPRDPLKRWRIAGLILPLAFLAVIEALVRASVLPEHLVPAPSTIAERCGNWAASVSAATSEQARCAYSRVSASAPHSPFCSVRQWA
jgi:hypothetical protein